jgi:colanic acid/amylovoran biosynthesis glycosyltransferase
MIQELLRIGRRHPSYSGATASFAPTPAVCRSNATAQSATGLIRNDKPAMRGELAYLVDQYPKISHSFIRTEIKALEHRGWQIRRFSVRGWKDRLVDPADLAERDVTDYILKHGIVSLIVACLFVAVSTPVRLSRAIWLAARMMRHSERPAILHLVYLLEACWLSRQLLADGVRHLHAHFGTNPADVAMLAHELTDIPFSFTVHGPKEFDNARGFHLAEKVARAKFVVTISSFSRSQLLRATPYLHWSKVEVVHCGVDETFMAAAAEIKPGCRRLVCVGRLCEQKGQALLVAAAATLRKSGLEFELVLVGDGEQRSLLESLIKSHDLGGVVSIVGWADAARVRQEIVSARALVLPSFAEGLPVVVMEAMVLGRPVITTYVAGIPELVIDGETGWLVPAGSEQALCDAIRDCLGLSDARIDEMGKKGKARALDRHNIDREVERLERLIGGASGC